jgi:anti-sigma factor (TIGR02949 family)
MSDHHRDCANIVRLLADFLERQLPAEVHRRLEQHLARCPRCVAQLKTYESTVALLRTIREEDLPEELRWTLRAFVDRDCRN